jgi:hypothetical protein
VRRTFSLAVLAANSLPKIRRWRRFHERRHVFYLHALHISTFFAQHKLRKPTAETTANSVAQNHVHPQLAPAAEQNLLSLMFATICSP